MTHENTSPQFDAPKENFENGLVGVNLPWLGVPERGKVRDIWVFGGKDTRFQLRLMVTTDRLSAYDRIVAAVPGKGQVLNLLSEFWFNKTKDIIPNHMFAIPHPNVLVAEQAQDVLPVELVVRKYMAQSSTSTSIYDNYANKGRRNIYGINFPEGLEANQEFPIGVIITPTTKAEKGEHDKELTDEQAREIVDGKLGAGRWVEAKDAALALFERGSSISRESGLLLVDTKYEMGLNHRGQLMLVDEVHTPDSSRFWLVDTYDQRMAKGQSPDSFDKEIARKWLAEDGFRGQGPIPKIDRSVIDKVAEAYAVPFQMLTGKKPPSFDPALVQASINYEIGRFIAGR